MKGWGAALLFVLGCADGRSVVTVSVVGVVPGGVINHFHVEVDDQSQVPARAARPIDVLPTVRPVSLPQQFALVLPAEVRGRITIVVPAEDGAGQPLARGQADASVQPSRTTGVTISLGAGVSDGGIDGPPGPSYYVAESGSDSDDGSFQHPFHTLSHADSVLTAGATVHVFPGTYSSASEVNLSKSGTASARIRFISDQAWGAQLRLTQAATNSAVLSVEGDYIDVLGFDVSGLGNLGIYVAGSNTRIIGNHVHDVAGSCSIQSAGIVDYDSSMSDDDISNNFVHDIGPSGSTCISVSGIYHRNLRGHIFNNLVVRNAGLGIQLWGRATQVIVANNTVVGNAGAGLYIGNSSGGTADNITVCNNIIVKNGSGSGASGSGIIEEAGSVGPNNRYLNNLVFQNLPADLSLQGKSAQNTVMADPSFVKNTGDATGDYHLQPGSPAADRGTADSAPTIDRDGASRPAGGAWDIGAYELGSPAGPWPYL